MISAAAAKRKRAASPLEIWLVACAPAEGAIKAPPDTAAPRVAAHFRNVRLPASRSCGAPRPPASEFGPVSETTTLDNSASLIVFLQILAKLSPRRLKLREV